MVTSPACQEVVITGAELAMPGKGLSRLPVPDTNGGTHHQMPVLKTNADYANYIASRTEAWLVNRKNPVK